MMGHEESSAVITAVMLSPVVPAAHIALIRLSGKAGRAVKFMMFSFVVYAVFWLAANLWAKGQAGVTGLYIIAGFSTGGFLCLGYAEAFSMLCRGFSLRIMMDVHIHGSLTLTGIIGKYGGGMGAEGLLMKRIRTMEKMGLVEIDGETLKAKGMRARFAGRMGLLVKNVLKMGEGG